MRGVSDESFAGCLKALSRNTFKTLLQGVTQDHSSKRQTDWAAIILTALHAGLAAPVHARRRARFLDQFHDYAEKATLITSPMLAKLLNLVELKLPSQSTLSADKPAVVTHTSSA